MPFYIRLGPHGLIIFIGGILHTRLGRTIYRRRRKRYAGLRATRESGSRAWRADAPENLTPEPVFVQIVRGSTREATRAEPLRPTSLHRESA
jgi:hypothetical protein